MGLLFLKSKQELQLQGGWMTKEKKNNKLWHQVLGKIKHEPGHQIVFRKEAK